MNHYKIELWIFTSSEDIASSNIKNFILNNHPFNPADDDIRMWDSHETYLMDVSKSKLFKKLLQYKQFFNIRLIQTDKEMISIDSIYRRSELDKIFRGDFIIFASRHRSKSEKPSLLTHATGNWTDDNSYGGSPNSISNTSALLLKSAYYNLNEQNTLNSLNWAVDLEVDHHGPTEINSPLIFMELGSSLEHWNDERGVVAVGEAILKTLADYTQFLFEGLGVNNLIKNNPQLTKKALYDFIKERTQTCNILVGIGFGGSHYAKSFSNISLNNKSVHISHILPKYNSKSVTSEHIANMINKTVENVNTAVIDWKGLNSSEKKHILNLIKDFDISIRKTKDFS